MLTPPSDLVHAVYVAHTVYASSGHIVGEMEIDGLNGVSGLNDMGISETVLEQVGLSTTLTSLSCAGNSSSAVPVTPVPGTVIQFDFATDPRATLASNHAGTVTSSSNSSTVSDVGSQSPSPTFECKASAHLAPAKEPVEAPAAGVVSVPNSPKVSHKKGASKAAKEAVKATPKKVSHKKKSENVPPVAGKPANVAPAGAKKVNTTPGGVSGAGNGAGFKPFNSVISPSVTLETGKMLPTFTPPGAAERTGRVLTPCSHWERQQFNSSPPLLMSPAHERLTPLGEPCLVEWFSSMEDGEMRMGCSNPMGKEGGMLEIISPAPLRFSIGEEAAGGGEGFGDSLNMLSLESPTKRVRSKSPWVVE